MTEQTTEEYAIEQISEALRALDNIPIGMGGDTVEEQTQTAYTILEELSNDLRED